MQTLIALYIVFAVCTPQDPEVAAGSSPARLILQVVDALFQELKGREEDRIDRAGPAHRDPEAAVHVALEELDLDGLDLLAFGVHQRVALIYALGRVDWIYLKVACY